MTTTKPGMDSPCISDFRTYTSTRLDFPGQSEGYVRIGPFVYKHGFPWYLGPGLRRYASNLGTTNARYVHHGPYS